MKARLRRCAGDVGLAGGAGEGNRTPTVSLGIAAGGSSWRAVQRGGVAPYGPRMLGTDSGSGPCMARRLSSLSRQGTDARETVARHVAP
jgi:hypothetical protein